MANASAPAAFTVALLLAALGLKITDLAKYFVSAIRDRSDDAKKKEAYNGIVTIAVTSIVAFVVIQFMLKPSAWGDEVTIGKESLKDLGLGSTIVFAIVFTALAGTLYDFKKAVDSSDSAKKPKLVE